MRRQFLIAAAIATNLATLTAQPALANDLSVRHHVEVSWRESGSHGYFKGSLRRHSDDTYTLQGTFSGLCTTKSWTQKVQYGKTTESWKNSDQKYCDGQERFWESPHHPIKKGDIIEIHLCVVGYFSTACGRKDIVDPWSD